MFNYTLREPVGVCGQIIPWNFPLLMAAWKLAPALAAGNTIVLKPAEQTPVTAMELGKLIQEAGFPEGVVNIVPGYGETAGAALASHPGIDKVAFTGSTEVGKLIAKAAADNLTKVSLELGGKAPNIVFADADIEQAVNGAMMGIFFNQGQVCCAGSRLFVEEGVKDQFLERFQEKSREDHRRRSDGQGDADGPTGFRRTTRSHQELCQHRPAGRRDGALRRRYRRSWKGISRMATSFSRRFSPDVNNQMRVAQEEIFGPVVSVITFQGRRRSDQAGERNRLRSVRRHLDQRHHARAPFCERDQGRRDLDQYLQHVQCGVAVRRIQAVGLRPRDGQARAGNVHAGEERLG